MSILLAVLLLFVSIGSYAQSPGAIKAAAREAKITPDLLLVSQPNKASVPITTGGLVKKDPTRIQNGMIAIEAAATTDDGHTLLRDLQALGLQNGKVYKRMVFGFLPIGQIDNLKGVSSLRFAKPSYKP